MTVVFSSSSPLASVALLDSQGTVIGQGQQEAGHKASGTLLFLLEHCLRDSGTTLSDARLFVADVGPGSFTGVKVGVTMAKTMAFALRLQVAGVTAFDLIDPNRPVAIPSRKGEYFLRVPGGQPQVVSSVPVGAVGYGVEPSLPIAANASRLEATLQTMSPELLVPLYVAEPSISKPRDTKLLGGPRA